MIRTGMLLLCNMVPSSHTYTGKVRLFVVVASHVCCCLVVMLLAVTAVGTFLHKV